LSSPERDGRKKGRKKGRKRGRKEDSLLVYSQVKSIIFLNAYPIYNPKPLKLRDETGYSDRL
jgi:hypothetical protein